MLSHLLPYLLYVAPRTAAQWLPAPARPWADPVAVLAAAAALAAFARRGRYPELARGPSPARGAALLALGAGLAAALLWMPLAELVPGFGSRAGFRPIGTAAPFLWAVRIVGFVAVIPLAEELLVRSLLPRYVDAADGWRERPVGAFTPLSAAVSAGFFALTHEAEWLAALVVGALWAGLLARTRRLRDAVLAHAVANGLLAAWWIATGDPTWW